MLPLKVRRIGNRCLDIRDCNMESSHYNIAARAVSNLLIDIERSYWKLGKVRNCLKNTGVSGNSWLPTTGALSTGLLNSLRSFATQRSEELGCLYSTLRAEY